MLQSYRRVLSLPGTVAFSAAGLLARLPMAMTGLGIVLLVSGSTGSYGTAGAVAAVYTLAGAAFQPLLGRWVDRYGQVRVATPSLAAFALGTAALAGCVQAGTDHLWWYASAAVMGAALPPWGSLVRARWAHAVRDRRALLPTAFAIEAVVDEAIFVTGPTLVTALVTLVHPAAGVGGAALLGVVGGLLLLAQRATVPPAAPRRTASTVRAPLGWRVLGPLTVASIGLGVFFGGAEVAAVAFTEEAGNRADAAWVLGLWATGSMVAGIVAGTLPAGSALRRLRGGTMLLTATMATTLLATSSGGTGGLPVRLGGGHRADADRERGTGRGDGAGVADHRGHDLADDGCADRRGPRGGAVWRGRRRVRRVERVLGAGRGRRAGGDPRVDYPSDTGAADWIERARAPNCRRVVRTAACGLWEAARCVTSVLTD